MDRHVRLDPRRDRRLPALLDREPQLVRDRVSACSSKQAAKPIDPAARSNEHASHILEALETGRVYRGHFNVKNNGVITNLPDDAIIESPGFVDRFGINMVAGITLPEACAATCISSINVQRMSVHAAISGDIDLLKLAVLHDPLVGAICTPEEVWQMVDEMVVAQAAVAAAICRCRAGRQGAACQRHGEDPRMGRALPAARSARSRSCAPRKRRSAIRLPSRLPAGMRDRSAERAE